MAFLGKLCRQPPGCLPSLKHNVRFVSTEHQQTLLGSLGLAFPEGTHVAEDHGLGNGDCTIDVTESLELLISVTAQNIVLLNSVQSLLLSLQFDDVWVRNNFLKQQHLAVPGEHSSLPLNADALVLMALRCYHHISLIQHKHFDFLGIYEFELGTPVQHDLLTSLHCWDRKEGKFQLWIKLPHLLNHFSCLQCQLVRWGKAQTLVGQRDNMFEVINTTGNATTLAYDTPLLWFKLSPHSLPSLSSPCARRDGEENQKNVTPRG
uniref:Uncharacterized protein n=1 Tax=Melopsittacus undulatus TaxID=13146 RepID=A0A8C6JRQ3_MELUD